MSHYELKVTIVEHTPGFTEDKVYDKSYHPARVDQVAKFKLSAESLGGLLSATAMHLELLKEME